MRGKHGGGAYVRDGCQVTGQGRGRYKKGARKMVRKVVRKVRKAKGGGGLGHMES